MENKNDLLREQMKKYVGMVQAQRRENSAKTTEGAAQMAFSSSDKWPKLVLIIITGM